LTFGEDDKLLPSEQILCNEGLGGASTEEPDDGGQKANEEYHEFLYWPSLGRRVYRGEVAKSLICCQYKN